MIEKTGESGPRPEHGEGWGRVPSGDPQMTTGFPLSGLRVVAFEQAVAGPLATRHLADAGAEIIKIERPEGGDFGRHYDTAVNGQSAYFVWLNRGKRSLAIDLKATGAEEITRRLVDSADIVLQNLAPGALDRLGFGYEAVSASKPGVIYCNISGLRPGRTVPRQEGVRLAPPGRERLDLGHGHAGLSSQGRHQRLRYQRGHVRL